MNRLRAMWRPRPRRSGRSSSAHRRRQAGQVGWGSQIRNYVLQPYQMVKTCAAASRAGNIAAVLDGDIDQFMEGYLRWKRATGSSGPGDVVEGEAVVTA